MYTEGKTSSPINEAVIEDAGNIFWQHTERNGEPPPDVMLETMVCPPALHDTHGQAGEILKNMSEALIIYVRGDIEDAISAASRTLQTVRNLASHIWQEKDEHGLPRECYAMRDGTTLAQCGISREWEQVT